MKKTKLLQILLVGILLTGAACSDIDDTPIDPVNTVTLNMLDEENGNVVTAGKQCRILRNILNELC
jgi:hypothetical protein